MAWDSDAIIAAIRTPQGTTDDVGVGVGVFGGALTVGCSRSWHRQRADQRAYELINSRQVGPRWAIPDRPVEPAVDSRMADVNSADCGPQPQDDPGADQFTRRPRALDNSKYYDKIPTNPKLENDRWFDTLPKNENGEIVLSEENVVSIALLHSREFQTEVEQLYLNSLGLASDRSLLYDVRDFARFRRAPTDDRAASTGNRFDADDTGRCHALPNKIGRRGR